MFTGIVRAIGEVEKIADAGGGGKAAAVRCPAGFLDGIGPGDSVCVDGCCLTLAAREGTDLARFDVSAETVARTAPLAVGRPVHLEGSLRVGDQVGGHFVYGHVDGTAEVTRVEGDGGFRVATLTVPTGVGAGLVAEKGSVAVAGVSLTVAGRAGGTFAVHLVPETLGATHFGSRDTLAEGATFNFEADPLARYAAGADC